jgi:hypothetical protein
MLRDADEVTRNALFITERGAVTQQASPPATRSTDPLLAQLSATWKNAWGYLLLDWIAAELQL